MNVLKKIPVSDRVTVVVFDGQPPHLTRMNWVVAVDRKAVWQMASTTRDLLPLALYMARKEAGLL